MVDLIEYVEKKMAGVSKDKDNDDESDSDDGEEPEVPKDEL